jgi:hypothetical protein
MQALYLIAQKFEDPQQNKNNHEHQRRTRIGTILAGIEEWKLNTSD